MLAHPSGAAANAQFDKLRGYAKAAGRDPNAIGLEVVGVYGGRRSDDWRRQFLAWKEAGVTHVTVNNTYNRGPHKRIAGKALAHHLAAMTSYREAVADLL
jgi:alkanesulfonate monooxygenase SsuD/methylene tetrahydromethanopterin reductase-like flavin-dependent oxidoreductase (luciferase family)